MRPWQDIKEYIDSRIQFLKLILSKNFSDILTSSINAINKNKQDKLKAGKNITIKNNVISAKDAKQYTAGQNINITNISENGEISAKGYTYKEDINSFSEGIYAQANGIASHAEGYINNSGSIQTTATGAHVEGCVMNDGYIFSAECGSHAEGCIEIQGSITANGRGSHAEGYVVSSGVIQATGNGSHAEGYVVSSGVIQATGNGSHAEGVQTCAGAHGGHAEGYNTKVGYNYGYNDKTAKGGGDYGENGHAEGDSCVAEGYASHAEGCLTFTEGINGNGFQHAEGWSTSASGSAAHAEGQSTSASGSAAHAEGQSTSASGRASHTEGNNTNAYEIGTHAEGESTVASGKYSHAEGYGTVSFAEASHAEGKFNKTNYITPDGFIDLELSSGTLWAKNNIGANPGSTAESYYGNYYAWGETQTKNYYAESNYTVTKYNDNDGKTKLDPEDDIATITYGSNYHMPTKTEITELLRLPNKWVTNFNNISGLNGKIFAKTQSELDGPFNENTMLFFPANGYWYTRGVSETGTTQYVWAANLNTSSKNQATSFVLDSSRAKSSNSYRYYGFGVRAVTQKIKQNTTQHSVGIGTDASNRKNAFEIMQNGDAYMIGVGGYDGTNPTSSQSIQQMFITYVPVGSILMWPTNTAPDGWLICNGQSIESGDEYAALRTVLNANVVPDLSGRFALGASNSHAIGSTGGEEEHTLSIDEMPSHSHTISKGYHYGGSSELSADVTINTYNLNSRKVRQTTADALTPEDLNPINYVDLNGNDLAHNNMPPYLTINYIIKYA